MNRDKMIFIALIVFLLLSAAYFAKAILYRVPEPVPVEQKKEIQKETDVKAVQKRRDYSIIRSKNVFSPDRSEQKETDTAAQMEMTEMPPAAAPQLDLKGIVQDASGEFTAYVSVSGEKARPMHVGERVDNLKVVSITITDVTMKWFEQEIKLTLSKVKSVGKQRE